MAFGFVEAAASEMAATIIVLFWKFFPCSLTSLLKERVLVSATSNPTGCHGQDRNHEERSRTSGRNKNAHVGLPRIRHFLGDQWRRKKKTRCAISSGFSEREKE